MVVFESFLVEFGWLPIAIGRCIAAGRRRVAGLMILDQRLARRFDRGKRTGRNRIDRRWQVVLYLN